MTLLAPLKHITTIKLPKLPKLAFFGSNSAALENSADRSTGSTSELGLLPPAPIEIEPTPHEVLEAIGAQLRQSRKQQFLSIDEISARTQIQPRLVEAIETGHVEMLPEYVYTKGMVKRYANSVGLNGSEIADRLLKWDKKAASFEPTATTKLQTTTLQIGRVNPLYIYLGYALAVVALGAGTSHLFESMGKSSQSATIDPATVRPQTAAKIAPVASTKTLPDIKVQISVSSPTWAQIGIDGRTKFTGNLQPGTKFDWVAQKQITVNTNNAGGLIISHGNNPAKPLGKIGQKQSVTIKVGG